MTLNSKDFLEDSMYDSDDIAGSTDQSDDEMSESDNTKTIPLKCSIRARQRAPHPNLNLTLTDQVTCYVVENDQKRFDEDMSAFRWGKFQRVKHPDRGPLAGLQVTDTICTTKIMTNEVCERYLSWANKVHELPTKPKRRTCPRRRSERKTRVKQRFQNMNTSKSSQTKKPQRVPKACDLCNKKHTRCIREEGKPCTECSNRNQECTFNRLDGSPGRPKRVSLVNFEGLWQNQDRHFIKVVDGEACFSEHLNGDLYYVVSIVHVDRAVKMDNWSLEIKRSNKQHLFWQHGIETSEWRRINHK